MEKTGLAIGFHLTFLAINMKMTSLWSLSNAKLSCAYIYLANDSLLKLSQTINILCPISIKETSHKQKWAISHNFHTQILIVPWSFGIFCSGSGLLLSGTEVSLGQSQNPLVRCLLALKTPPRPSRTRGSSKWWGSLSTKPQSPFQRGQFVLACLQHTNKEIGG